MDVVLRVLLFAHLLSWAVVLGSAIVGMRSKELFAGAFHAALSAVVTGVAMVLVIELWLPDYYRTEDSTFPAWVAVKLILGLAITALVWLGRRRPERVGPFLLGSIAGLTVLNVGVATLWA